MLWDLQTILEWSRLFIEEGKYTGLYPPLLYVIFYPLTLINIDYIFIFYTVIFVGILIYYEKKNSLYAFVFYPMFNTWVMGQLTIFLYWFWKLKRPFTYALASLKPHLFLLMIPDIIKEKKIIKTLLWMSILHGISFILYPNWVAVMWKNALEFSPIGKFPFSPTYNFIEYYFLFIIGTFFLLHLLKQDNLKYIIAWFNIGLVIYDYGIFVDKNVKWLVPLSWIFIFIGAEYYYLFLLYWLLNKET